MSDVAQEFLNVISQFVGLPGLSFDEDGFCQLQFQDQFLFTAHSHEQRLVITAELDPPPTLSSELFASILTFNGLRVTTPGAWIALQEETGTLFLADDFHLLNIETELWKARLTLFFKHYFTCQGFLNKTVQDFPAQNPPPETAPVDLTSFA